MNFTPVRIVAALWALSLAALQVVWSNGRSGGASPADLTGATGWPVGGEVAFTIGCLIAAAVALWGQRWMLILVGLLSLVRGLIGLGLLCSRMITGEAVAGTVWWVDPLYVLGGVLFMIGARRPANPALPIERRHHSHPAKR
ncbi:MAG TPA: hypothetical protein VIP98_20420 [Microlunatus sp.]